MGYTIQKRIADPVTSSNEEPAINADISNESKLLFTEASPYTMTSLERMDVVVNAIDYISKNNIEGDIVECGVWRGGAMYVAAKALVKRNDFKRKFYLFDTYDVDTFGATQNIDESDKDFLGKTAQDAIEDGSFVKTNYNYHLGEVKRLLESTGYPKENFIYVEGRVEDTIPYKDISDIALLRLDTDWYESTKHELIHLFPQLVKDGVLLIDDYGFWQGCRKACDEYFEEHKVKIMLHRTDFTGRSAIKL
jgi:hypothetical protein